jgi:zinc protease
MTPASRACASFLYASFERLGHALAWGRAFARGALGAGVLAASGLAVSGLALVSAPPAVAAERAAPARGVPVHKLVSPGGVSAWVVSDSTVPMIVLSAYWKGGATSDPKGLDGVTSTFADMMTEGAGDLNSEAFKERLEDLNMSLGFSAGWDGVSMDLTTLTKNRDAAFEMARLALTAPRFEAEPLARIKRQALIGIKQRETSPGYIANVALDDAQIPGHPYAARTSVASVTAIDKAALEARRAAILARDNLQITVVGDIDDATLGRLLDKTFGALPAKATAPPAPDVAARPGPGLIVRTLPQPQSVILFSAPGIQDEDPDWIPLVIANYILGGGGFSSRLMDEVREKNGLVYGISTSASVRDHLATLRGSAQTKNASVARAIDMIKAEIRRLHDQGATDQEVADARTYLTGSFALALDGDAKIASVLQSYQVAGRTIDYVNRRNALIAAVTTAHVNRVIKRLFNADAFIFVVVGQPVGLHPTP